MAGRRCCTVFERGELVGQDVEVGKVVWGEQLSLYDREVDFNLVEPGSVHRRVDHGRVGKRFSEPCCGGPAAVGAAVVHDPKPTPRRGLRLAGHDFADERGQGFDADAGARVNIGGLTRNSSSDSGC